MAHPDDRSGSLSQEQVDAAHPPKASLDPYWSNEPSVLRSLVTKLRGEVEKWQTKFYEADASHTESNGMLYAEARSLRDKLANKEREAEEITKRYAAYISPEQHSMEISKGVRNWTPISERKPERDVYVLLYLTNPPQRLDGGHWGPQVVGCLNWDDFEGSEDWCARTDLGITPIKGVTHWMPLPEAPK